MSRQCSLAALTGDSRQAHPACDRQPAGGFHQVAQPQGGEGHQQQGDHLGCKPGLSTLPQLAGVHNFFSQLLKEIRGGGEGVKGGGELTRAGAAGGRLSVNSSPPLAAGSCSHTCLEPVTVDRLPNFLLLLPASRKGMPPGGSMGSCRR